MRRIKNPSLKQMREEQEYANRMRCAKGRRSGPRNPTVSLDGQTFWRKEPRTYTVKVVFTPNQEKYPNYNGQLKFKFLADGYSWKQVVEYIKTEGKGHFTMMDMENISVKRLPDADYVTLQNRFKEWYRK